MPQPEISPANNGQPTRLSGLECGDCGTVASPMRAVCPACMSENVTAVAMPDEGIVYAYSTVHAAPRKWITPYAIGYVDLPNGARVFSHLQGDGLAVGARVRLAAGVVGVTPEGAPRTQSVFVVKGETP